MSYIDGNEEKKEILAVLRGNENRYAMNPIGFKEAQEEFALASARKRIEEQRFDEAAKRFSEIEKYMKTYFYQEANELWKKNIGYHGSMRASWKNTEASSATVSHAIMRALTDGMSNVISTPTVIAQVNVVNSSRNWKLVLGKEGFKRRDNIQAQPLEKHDVFNILAPQAVVNEIIAGLGKLKNKDGQIRFKKLVASFGDEKTRVAVLKMMNTRYNSDEIGLSVPLNPPITFESKTYDSVKLIDDDSLTFANADDKNKGSAWRSDSFTIRFARYEDKLRQDDVPEYLACFERIPEIAQKFKEEELKTIKGIEDAKTNIDTHFRGFFLAKDL